MSQECARGTPRLEDGPWAWGAFVGLRRGGEGDRGTGLGSWGGGRHTGNPRGWCAGCEGFQPAVGPGALLGTKGSCAGGSRSSQHRPRQTGGPLLPGRGPSPQRLAGSAQPGCSCSITCSQVLRRSACLLSREDPTLPEPAPSLCPTSQAPHPGRCVLGVGQSCHSKAAPLRCLPPGPPGSSQAKGGRGGGKRPPLVLGGHVTRLPSVNSGSGPLVRSGARFLRYSSLDVAIPCPWGDTLRPCAGHGSLGPPEAPPRPGPWHHPLALRETPSFGLRKKRGGSAVWAWLPRCPCPLQGPAGGEGEAGWNPAGEGGTQEGRR